MRISDWRLDVCSSDLVSSGRSLSRRDRRSTCTPIGKWTEIYWAMKYLHRCFSRSTPSTSSRLDRCSRFYGRSWADVGLSHRLLPSSGWHRSDEHPSELPSLIRISYAVFFLKHTT